MLPSTATKIRTQDNPGILDFQRDLISALSLNAWIFESVEPGFRAQLLEGLRLRGHVLSGDESLTELAARFYRKSSALKKPNCSSLQIVSDRDVEDFEFWQIALATHKRNVSLGRRENLNLSAALEILEQNLPDAFRYFENSVSHVCICKTDQFLSASHPHFYGTLFLAEQTNVRELAVSIVHELAHQELFLLNLVDRLVKESSDFSLAHAPYQRGLRPPIGRLHSAHALWRMIQLEQKIWPEKASEHRRLLSETKFSLREEDLTLFAFELASNVY